MTKRKAITLNSYIYIPKRTFGIYIATKHTCVCINILNPWTIAPVLPYGLSSFWADSQAIHYGFRMLMGSQTDDIQLARACPWIPWLGWLPATRMSLIRFNGPTASLIFWNTNKSLHSLAFAGTIYNWKKKVKQIATMAQNTSMPVNRYSSLLVNR